MFTHLWSVLKRILLITGLLLLLRILFVLINPDSFADLSVWVIIKALAYAIRIDMAALLLLNSWLLIIAALFPVLFTRHNRLFAILFNISNSLLLILYVIDNIFFAHTQRRLTYDLLLLAPQSISWQLLGTYLYSFWYWLLLLLISIIVLIYIPRVDRSGKALYPITIKARLINGLIIILLFFIVVRGIGNRPLTPSSALLYFSGKEIILTSNTFFDMLYSWYKGQRELEDKHFFKDEELDKRFQIFHTIHQTKESEKPNVVLFIMESFTSDYLTPGAKFKAYTPFLDSVISHSLLFTNALANGYQSTEGIVSILGSIPPLMEHPIYRSLYHKYTIRGIGHILKEKGYESSFFLGDKDNSFGFREFTHSIGIDHYYSMKDFGNDSLYNGAWGIHDEYFFQFAADVIDKKEQPFFSVIYNVSSHQPFIIPKTHKKEFTIPHQTPAQNSISYVDHCFKKFFEKVQKEPWYSNTVFIFIADHYYPPSKDLLLNGVNNLNIPFFIFKPGKTGQKYHTIVQQLDVVPAILDIIGYQGAYMSFGKNPFKDTVSGFAVQKEPNLLQIMDSSYAAGLNDINDTTIYLYNYRSDSQLANNLINDKKYENKKKELTDLLKAIRQRYNYSVKYNKLHY